MKVELFPFQQKAVSLLRDFAANALESYRRLHIPQVISLQAPTGAGKTIILSALIEDIYFGTEKYMNQPDAIFVWLSDSPALNEQSKQKIDLKADKIKFGQCVTIEDESFDAEMLEDGHIYFLNTQKLGKAGNLGKHSDSRQYTIWETLENTAREKSDRLYFVIDEAHRGMQGREAGKATSIMQRFIKGSETHKLHPMPVVIGMSATSERFNRLVGNTSASLMKVVVTPADVRASGLLKDRILITYPEDPSRHNDMAVLQAAADEWKSKCVHWHQYCFEQHYAQVNPVFVIQVQPGTGRNLSDTDLDDVLARIEQQIGKRFGEHEVVHTFGSTGNITINGLTVPHVEPEEITDDRRIRVVLFKENLSIGWDCPRAETMMSFRRATDATYIAQLLGRMVRTPTQSHILVDDYLNDVRLFLPYFDRDTVRTIVEELQAGEGGDIPVDVDSESMENAVFVSLTVHTKRRAVSPVHSPVQIPGQESIDLSPVEEAESVVSASGTPIGALQDESPLPERRPIHLQSEPLPISRIVGEDVNPAEYEVPAQAQLTFLPEINREEITKFINSQCFLTYVVRSAKIHSYLKSLLDLAALLTHSGTYKKAMKDVDSEIIAMIHKYCENLRSGGQYTALFDKVMQFKLLVDVYDIFGISVRNDAQSYIAAVTGAELEQQEKAADAKLGGCGICHKYMEKYSGSEGMDPCLIDCILFAADDRCMADLNAYAQKKFNQLNDDYRRIIANKEEQWRKQYDSIVSDSDLVTKHNFMLPETISVKSDPDGKRYDNHLFALEDGTAQIKLNGWETDLIEEESKRPDFVCWLRNPPREKWALCLPYEIVGETKATYPDFIIVRSDPYTGYVLDILEPHGSEYKDNLGKAKALAKYAQDEKRIGHVQLIRREKDSLTKKDRFIRLDMSKAEIREKVLKAVSTDEIDHLFDDLLKKS